MTTEGVDARSKLAMLPGRFAILRLDPGDDIPAWAWGGSFASVSRTGSELSIVREAEGIPEDVDADRGWRAMIVAGPMDLSIVGVLASIAGPLAGAGIPIFAVSTYETDIILVREEVAADAAEALRKAGHEVGE